MPKFTLQGRLSIDPFFVVRGIQLMATTRYHGAIKSQAAVGPSSHSVKPAARASRGVPSLDWGPLAALLAIPLGITIGGWSYYSASAPVRLRHPLHDLLRPSGVVGLWLGILGLALFLFLWLYPLRKHVRWLAWTGQVSSWLRVHIVCGLSVPVIVAAHAGWRFEGLIGLGYWAMLTVALSGIVGRYLYTHIPRSRDGLEMSIEEVASERRALITEIAAATGLSPMAIEHSLAPHRAAYQGLGLLRTVVRLVADDWERTRTLSRLRRQWSTPQPGRAPIDRRALRRAMTLSRRELGLAQQVRLLGVTRRLFGYWHVAHRPFAVTALLAVLVHVVVAWAVGAVHLGGGPS
ncbi:MAG TPA: hypothetical protein VFQ05_05025 [Candidatus Eisenbacteria bacterium]|nr:hypothetical protein [Candidatus Eisenbacteria bacterium]